MSDLIPGVPRALSPLVRRILAPNPNVMTGPGTNTYLVGIDEVAVIDPGPDDEGHLDAILGCGGDRIRWVLCTHTHEDHSPLAGKLAERTRAEVLAYESRDGLEVDSRLSDGDRLDGTEFRLTAVHTPGHASNHLCFLLEQESALFSGDHIMEGSTVVIAPPDGDMAAYLASLELLLDHHLARLYPGHGPAVGDPRARVEGYLAHRREREAQVLAALEAGDRTPAQVVARVYAEVDPLLHPAAELSVRAHLVKLVREGRVGAAAGGERFLPGGRP